MFRKIKRKIKLRWQIWKTVRVLIRYYGLRFVAVMLKDDLDMLTKHETVTVYEES